MTDRRIWAGWTALLFAGVLLGGAFAGLLLEVLRSGGSIGGFDFYLARIAGFTLWQAVLSTLVSVLPGLIVARALHRQQSFPGRSLLLGLFAVPLALSTLR